MRTTLQTQDAATLELAARLRVAIVRTARRMRQQADAGLSPSLMAMLGTIDRHGPLTPSELAKLEGIKRPTATALIAKLEEQGLITRAACDTDRRSCRVTITQAGRGLMTATRRRKNAYLARGLRGLEPAELRRLEEAAALLEGLLAHDGR
jgi:DNA-binding MarR family transcriptional regulator